jgi:hypothetical protein
MCPKSWILLYKNTHIIFNFTLGFNKSLFHLVWKKIATVLPVFVKNGMKQWQQLLHIIHNIFQFNILGLFYVLYNQHIFITCIYNYHCHLNVSLCLQQKQYYVTTKIIHSNYTISSQQ